MPKTIMPCLFGWAAYGYKSRLGFFFGFWTDFFAANLASESAMTYDDVCKLVDDLRGRSCSVLNYSDTVSHKAIRC